MKLFYYATLLLVITSCSELPDQSETNRMKFESDPHSFAQPNEAFVTHLELDVNVDFNSKVISGVAKYSFNTNSDEASEIIFDTKDLEIIETSVSGKKVDFKLGEEDEELGTALIIPVSTDDSSVSITFKTSQSAEALQWLSPQQTAGKKHPFLFTQSQAILARTWLPCQDSPGIRFTYNANVKVPENLMALMSATNPKEKNESGEYSFEMKQPIPSYLMALAVGNVVFRPVGERTGVYAEPELIEASVYEFSEMEDMLLAAEKLYGPYVWERYDLIVLPPSFPFGGMENPRLTFATPTIIAGDRSLTSLVAHELAHSWSGNLVTNATWDDFWLNEGFTVYFEHRIMEAVYGRDYSEMLASLSYEGLLEEMEEIKNENEKDTHLKLDLKGRNPDDGMTAIAYDKGYFFLRMLEENLGREKFDAFLNDYFTSNSFEVMTTEEFIEILKSKLLNEEQYRDLLVDKWIYGPGLPENCPKTDPVRFEKVEKSISELGEAPNPNFPESSDWTTHEWLHFLKNLPPTTSLEMIAALDKKYNFTNSGNREIQAAWFQITIPAQYQPADSAVKDFLVTVGRRKFLTPTYKALIKVEPDMKTARAIYAEARPNYHSVSYQTIDELLKLDKNQ